jgi:hypothetical protein
VSVILLAAIDRRSPIPRQLAVAFLRASHLFSVERSCPFWKGLSVLETSGETGEARITAPLKMLA